MAGTVLQIVMSKCQVTPVDGHVDIPLEWTEIPDRAFEFCDPLESVTIHNGIKEIGWMAFYHARNLKQLTIPQSVTKIGKSAFRYLRGITALEIPESITDIPDSVFADCSGLVSISLPKTLVSIGRYAFQRCYRLPSITIPKSVIKIDDGAFQHCTSLQSINFESGGSRLTIGTEAFADCEALISVEFPASLTSIESQAFKTCTKLSSVTLNEGLSYVGNEAFASTMISKIALPSSLNEINRGVFSQCQKLTEVDFGQSRVTKINDQSFENCGRLKLDIPITVEHIGDRAFAETGFESIIIPNHVTSMGASVFANSFLKSIYFQSTMPLVLAGSALDSISALNGSHVYVSKAATDITGFSGIYARFVCKEAECQCGSGYGSYVASSSNYFNCIPCGKGSYSEISTRGPCTPCPQGSYSSATGAISCTPCPSGRYGQKTGALSDIACHECPRGRFQGIAGSSECTTCPPGAFCPTEGEAAYEPCPKGTMATYPGSKSCASCPPGTYENVTGSAVCKVCPVGTSSPLPGSVSYGNCTSCPAGRYASQQGTAECSQCQVGQFQPLKGQRSCQVCTEVYNDLTLTSNAAFTACEKNKDLAAASMIELMFEDGVALYATAAITMLFVGLAAAIQYMREKEGSTLGQLTRPQAVLKSFLPGFSFSSEMFLIIGVFQEMKAVAIVMMLFRLLHCFGGALLIRLALEQKASAAASIGGPFISRASSLHTHTDHAFVRAHLPQFAMLSFLTLCDVTMIQHFPWKISKFHVESKGFPSMGAMRCSLSIKTIQATASVICQSFYLYINNTLSNPYTSPQEKALFFINITLSACSMVMGLLLYYMKNTLLGDLDKEEMVVEKTESSVKEETDGGESGAPTIADLYPGDGVGMNPKRRQPRYSIEMNPMQLQPRFSIDGNFRSSIEDSVVPMQTNPMLFQNQSIENGAAESNDTRLRHLEAQLVAKDVELQELQHQLHLTK